MRKRDLQAILAKLHRPQRRADLGVYIANLAEASATSAGAQPDGSWVLKGVEVFGAGTWKGVPYTEADLDAMARNFTTLHATGFEPPFKVDHSDMFRPESANDVVGYVVSLYRDGALLKADLEVTEKSAQAKIKSRTWRKVSAEIYMPKFAAKEFPGTVGHVFRAVSVVAVPQLKHIRGLALNWESGEGAPLVNEELKKKITAALAKIYGEKAVEAMTEEQLQEFAEGLGLVTAGEDDDDAAGEEEPGADDDDPKADKAKQHGEGGTKPKGGQPAPKAKAKAKGGQQDPPADDAGADSVAKLSELVGDLVGTVKEQAKQIGDLTKSLKGINTKTTAGEITAKLRAYAESGKILPAQIKEYQTLAEDMTDQQRKKLFAVLDAAGQVVPYGELGTYGADADDETTGALKIAREMFGK